MYLGRYSLLLLIGALNGWMLAGLLLNLRRNRPANRALAALVALIGLRLMPYVLGYAGAYDTWRGLTFFPFDLSLAFGPLLWAYVVRLTTGANPVRWRLHLLPAVIQLGYGLVCFALPLDAKWAWYTGPHLHAVGPFEAVAAALSLLVYTAAAWRRFRRWQAWLDQNVSNREELRLGWLQVLLVAVGVAATLATGFAITPVLGVPLNYFDRFPLMVALAVLAYLIGMMGWRNGEREHPVPLPGVVAREQDVPSGDAESVSEAGRAGTDYGTLGHSWQSVVETEGWYRDPDLTLARLAERLGTSSRTLSRVLNEGLGVSFNAFVNALRARAAEEALADPGDTRDVLEIALDVGFSSKSSFNRAFREHVGRTPTEVRRTARARPDFRHDAPLA